VPGAAIDAKCSPEVQETAALNYELFGFGLAIPFFWGWVGRASQKMSFCRVMAQGMAVESSHTGPLDVSSLRIGVLINRATLRHIRRYSKVLAMLK